MKWLIRSALTLITLVLLAVVVLVMVPTERVARLAADQFEAATGRALTLGGPVKATLWPRLGVRAEDVEVANADWAADGPMLRADSLEVGIALGAILGGDIRIETLEVSGARLALERRADGTGNWQIARAPSGQVAGDAGAPGGRAREITVGRAVLTGAEVTWRDAVTGRDLTLRAVDLETRLDGLDSPFAVTASALMQGQAISVEASAEALRPLLDGTLAPVSLSIDSGQTTLRLDGRADIDPPSFEGRVEAKSTDRFALLRAFAMEPPALPQGFGAGSVALDAAVTLAPAGTLHLRDMVAALDGNRFTGAIDIDPTSARPRIAGNIAAETLDLTVLSRKGQGGGQGGTGVVVAERGWGRTPFDASALFAVDGELTFSSGPITLGDATLDELRARIAIEDGRAVVTLQPLLAYGGTVTGDVVVNGRGGLSARATLDLSGLQMQPFLTEFADFDRLVGQADVSVDLLGVGITAQALVDSLNGAVSARMGRGELLGLDIAGMVRTRDLDFRGEGQKTVFDGFSASFGVAGGVATGDDLTLDATYLTATGAGQIALGARTLDYRLIPTVRTGEGGTSLSVPILFQGPWADPRIRLDLEYLARQRLDEERAVLEARAREEVDAARLRAEEQARTRLAEELEVAPEALQSREAIEDAIADRVEQQLLDLLQRR